MKKLIYSLAIALIGMTSCTSFDDEHSESYGDGPAVSINLVTTEDSCFTFTVNPAEGTEYYSYVVVEGDEAQEGVETSVLKANLNGAIASGIVDYTKNASVTENMRTAKKQPLCLPNESYVVYAIASDNNGSVGKVASLVVKTTDGEIPVLEEYEAKEPTDENDVLTTVTFSEAVERGEGAITASYFQEWGDGNLIPIPAEDLKVEVMGNKVSFLVDNVPNGVYVLYSWAEGAFVDSFGNKCPATNTQFTEEGIAGVYKHMPLKAWDILDENVAPEAGSLIDDYKTFKGTMTFDHDIFRNEELVENGDISVVYTGSKKSSTIQLASNEWSVAGKTLTFTLPEAPAAGDIITVKVKANVIFDINGNGNNAYVSTTKTVWWKYFAMTKDMVLGTFTFTCDSKNFGEVTIEEDTDNQLEIENGLIIHDLFAEGSVVGGYYDLKSGKVYIGAGYPLEFIDHQTYGKLALLTYSLSGKDVIEFTVNPNGTLTSTDFGVLATDEAMENAIGWWLKAEKATLLPANNIKASASSRKAFAPKKSYKKSHVMKANLKVNARRLKTLKK